MFPVHVLPVAEERHGLPAVSEDIRLPRVGEGGGRDWGGRRLLETLRQEERPHGPLLGQEVSPDLVAELQYLHHVDIVRETAQCQDHSACSAHLRCVAGHCGDGGYLEALAQQSCQDHHLCHDLLLGPDCCFDIRGGVEKISSGDMSSTWGKKCCDNLWSPITRPPDNLTADVVTKVSSDRETFAR